MKKQFMLFIIILVIGIVGCVGCGQGFNSFPEASEAENIEAAEEAGPHPDTEVSSFEVHFIDVGQADAALVLCDGKAMLIDGGNRADSSLIYSYLKQRGVKRLDYMVCTHPHEDHAGGLAGALNFAAVGVAYAPVRDYDSEVFRDFRKYLEKQGVTLTVPKAGEKFRLGSAEVSVVGPADGETGAKLNNTSIVLRIAYGNTSFLFTGDAEREEELAILEAGYELQSTVLKVGHHGGATSTTYPFLREVAPEYAVISVGEDNSYGHPTEDVLSRLRDADVEVYRTDRQGTVVCRSDGESVSFEAGGRGDAGVQEAETAERLPEGDYVLNIKSMKFHYPNCQSVAEMKETNKQFYSGGRDALAEQGYSPCGRCLP